jgi:ATP-dependent DNA helicase PIF1
METTLSTIVVYLKKLVFTHGQLYVTVSRVTSKDELKILIQDDNGEATYETQNIVYIGECPRVAVELLFVQRYF